MRISHREKEKQGSIIRPSACQGYICAAEAETLDRHRTHDRGSQEDDGAERFAILHNQRRDQHKLVSSQAGKQPPGTYSLSTHYGLRPEREGLHLVLQLRQNTTFHTFLQFFVLFLKTAPNQPRIRLRTKNCFLQLFVLFLYQANNFSYYFPIFSTVFLCQKYNFSYYFQHSGVRSTICGIRKQPIPVSRSADPGPILCRCIRQDTHLSDICPLRGPMSTKCPPGGRSC